VTSFICACGLPATLIADVQANDGAHIRTPLCSAMCPVVAAEDARADVVVCAEDILPLIRARVCWCSLRTVSEPGQSAAHVTWCPTHGWHDPTE
jgi:hypothetical protein